jgi:membrane-associated protein
MYNLSGFYYNDNVFNIESSLGDTGVIAALAIIGSFVFAECALLIGLFLPGSELFLLVAGVLAAQGILPLAGVLIVAFIATTAGYEVGYRIGEKTGPRIFKQKAGFLFRKEYIEYATRFYARHGGKTILMARCLGYVRTLAPLLAGASQMQRSKFTFYNISGALLWTVLMVMLGYWFGSAFTKEIKHYTLLATLLGLVFLCGAMIVFLIKGRHSRNIRRKLSFGRQIK